MSRAEAGAEVPPPLDVATVEALLPIVLGRAAYFLGPRRSGVDLAPYAPEVEARLRAALAAERKRRRALSATGLGSWFLADTRSDGDQAQTELWTSSYAPSGAMARAREALRTYPGAPIRISPRVEPSPDYPGMIRATVELFNRATPPQVVARASFTSLGEDQRGPIGFAPDGVRIKAHAGVEPIRDTITGKPRTISGDGTGTLGWDIGARVRGDAPRVSSGMYSAPTDPHGEVTVLEDPQEYAVKMALTMAVSNALSCRKGWAPACLDGGAPVVVTTWPPKPRARDGLYTENEWKAAYSQMPEQPIVKEALASGRLTPREWEDWRQDFYDSHRFVSGLSPGSAALMRARLLDPGDAAGRVARDGTANTAGADRTYPTFPAYLAHLARVERLRDDLTRAKEPEDIIAAYLRRQAEYPTGYSIPASVLVEPFRRMGWLWQRDELGGDLYAVLTGREPWSAFAARRKAAQEEAQAKQEAQQEARGQEHADLIYRLASLIPQFTPGVYTSAGARTRFMDQHKLRLKVRAPYRETDSWLVNLSSPTQSATGTYVGQGPDMTEEKALRSFLGLVQEFARRRPARETGTEAMHRWEDLVRQTFNRAGMTINGRPFFAKNVGDLRTVLEAKRAARQRRAAQRPGASASTDVPDASGWGLSYGLQRDLSTLVDNGRLPQANLADDVRRWVFQAAGQARDLRVPRAQSLLAFTVVWDFAQGQPPGTTSPDSPFALAALRLTNAVIAHEWEHREQLFAPIPKPFPAEWLQPGPGLTVDPGERDHNADAASAVPDVEPDVALDIPEPPPLAPEPAPEPPRRPQESARLPAASSPAQPAQPAPAGVRGFRAARAARTGADVWPPTGKPVVQRLIELAPTPADFTPDLAAQLYAELEPRARGSLAVYLREAVALGRLDGDVIAAFGG